MGGLAMCVVWLVMVVGRVWGVGGHDYWGCYVIGDSRLNFSRSSYSRLPATLNVPEIRYFRFRSLLIN